MNRPSIDCCPCAAAKKKYRAGTAGFLKNADLLIVPTLIVLCWLMPGDAHAANEVDNPSFESAPSTEWIFDTTGAAVYSGGRTTAWKTHGTYSYRISYSAVLFVLGSYYGRVYQTSVYLTDVDYLYFDAQLTAGGINLATMTGSVRIDTTTVWTQSISVAGTNTYTDQAINVSSYTGWHTLEFRLTNASVLGLLASGSFIIDNIWAFPADESPGMTMVKSSTAYSDPINSTTNPKRIPGATVTYTIVATNSSTRQAGEAKITDTIPSNTNFVVGSVTGPTGYSVEYSNNSGSTWTYSPSDSGDGTDPNVTNIRVSCGTISVSGTATVTFKVKVE